MKYKYTKNSLLEIPYYDYIYTNSKLKKKLFERYHKEYSVKKSSKTYEYRNCIIKKKLIFIELNEHSFTMSNCIFGVLNLYSFEKCLLKVNPSFEKIFARIKKDLSTKSKRRIRICFSIHGIDERTQSPFDVGTGLAPYTTMEELLSAYENFMREYTLDRSYYVQIRTIIVEILYHYNYEKKKNTRKTN